MACVSNFNWSVFTTNGCDSTPWTIGDNGKYLSYIISDSLNCGGICNELQEGTANGLIDVGDENVYLTLDLFGIVEATIGDKDQVYVYLNNQLIIQGTSISTGIGCITGEIQVTYLQQPPYLLAANTQHTIDVFFSSDTPLNHQGCFVALSATTDCTLPIPTFDCSTCSGTGWVPYDSDTCIRENFVSATPPTNPLSLIEVNGVTYSTFGTQFFESGFNSNGIGTVEVELRTPVAGGSYTGTLWANVPASLTGGPLNRCALWPTSGGFPTQTWVGFSACLNGITATKTYYVGIGADNEYRLVLDGVEVLNTLGNAWTDEQFKWWHVYPIEIGAGDHTLELYGLNEGAIAGFGCEIYDNTLEQLTGFTLYSQLNVIFTSSGKTTATIVQNVSGTYLSSGYTCPSGYVYSVCENNCVKYEFCQQGVLPAKPCRGVNCWCGRDCVCVGENCPTPSPTPTNTVTPSFTPTLTVTPTMTNTPTITPSPCYGCTLWTVTINQGDLDVSPDGKVYVDYVPCNSLTSTRVSYSYAGVYQDNICVNLCYTPIICTDYNPTCVAPVAGSNLSNTNKDCKIIDPVCNEIFSLPISEPGYTEFYNLVELGQSFGNVEVTISGTDFNEITEIFVGNLENGFGDNFIINAGQSTQTKTVGFFTTRNKRKLDISIYSEGSVTNPFSPHVITFKVVCPTTIPCIDPSRTPTPTTTPTYTPTTTPTLSPTKTPTTTPTPTVTPTIPPTPSFTPTLSPTETITPTPSPSVPYCCYAYEITNYYSTSVTIYYSSCDGNPLSINAQGNGQQTYIACAAPNSISYIGDTCENTNIDCISLIQGSISCNGCEASPTPTPTLTLTPSPTTVFCDSDVNYGGGQRYPTNQVVNLGPSLGVVTFNYTAYTIPDRFILTFEGNRIFDSGYRGSTTYNYGGIDREAFNFYLTGLIDPVTNLAYPNLATSNSAPDGFPIVSPPGVGGTFSFNKTTSTTSVLVSVYGPDPETAWLFEVKCATPFPSPTTTPTGTATPTVTPTLCSFDASFTEVFTPPYTPDPPGQPAPCSSGMDVVFVVDYTGSMGGAIDGVKNSIASIANTIVQESDNNYRLGLVIFDESGGQQNSYTSDPGYTSLPASQKYVVQGNRTGKAAGPNYIFITAVEKMSSNNASSFTTQLNKLNTAQFSLGDGLFGPEPSDLAVNLVATNNVVGYNYFAGTFRNGVSKIIILITDNLPSGTDDAYDSNDVAFVTGLIQPLYNQNIRVLLMTTASNNILYTLATGTNGLISNGFSGAQIIKAIQDICP